MKKGKMVLQIEIPNNWSKSSDNDISAYIKHLQSNIEGRVTVSDDYSTLHIGNVTIKREYKTNEWDETLEVYTVNGRVFYSTDKNFTDISDLFARGVAMAGKIEEKETGIYPPQADVTEVQNQSVWIDDIHYDYPSGDPENTDVINKTVRALFQQYKKKVKYGDFGLLTITDDANGMFQRHALSIEGKSSRLLIEDKQILHNGKLYPMDEETLAMVQTFLDKQKKKSARRKITVGVLVVLGCGAFIIFAVNRCNRFVKDNGKKARAIQEYAKTLPNYNDSIRLVQPNDEAELQRLFRLREQNELKIKHFADSINNVKK